MKIWSTIEREVRASGRCALVSVTSTQGSAPRDAGTHMVVTSEGYRGTIGGGTLEWRAIAAAQSMLARGTGSKLTSHALGPELGQCCGGRVELLTEVFTSENLSEISDLAARETEGPFTINRSGADLAFGSMPRQVYLFGAGHVGRALVLALAPLAVSVRWIDPRAEAFPRAIPENVSAQAPADPLAALANAPTGSLVFVMTHSHALDLAIVDAALRNPALANVGLIGSATKRARFESRLRQAGVATDRIESLICPIGIPGIRSKEPAVIAAGVAAQILVLDEALRLASKSDQPQADGSDRRVAR
jgi:xanthine dehydrogenase accessory factor